MSDNVIEVKTTNQFQELLSADLNKISLINFWAPWAAPCKKMNEVAVELAKKHSSLLVLQVEAETHEEISASFDVEEVPSFVLIRGHTLLGRVRGADAPALTDLVAKHLSNPVNPPVKEVERTVQAEKNEEPQESKEQLTARMLKLMQQSRVVLFMKGEPDAPRCGFSRTIVSILREQGVEFTHFDILKDEAVRQGLKELNEWPTFPQLIVNGEFVGGLDIVKEMVSNGEFAEALASP